MKKKKGKQVILTVSLGDKKLKDALREFAKGAEVSASSIVRKLIRSRLKRAGYNV